MPKSKLFIADQPTGHTITETVPPEIAARNTVETYPAPNVVLDDKTTNKNKRQSAKQNQRLECYPPPLVILAKEGG
jgi:hypothetical protein